VAARREDDARPKASRRAVRPYQDSFMGLL
jgi:hypothetical protein